MFDLPKPKRNIHLQFRCLACEREFRRQPSRVYVDVPTFNRKYVDKLETSRSAFIIPKRIVCTKCGAVDEYELHEHSRMQLGMTMLVGALAGSLAEGHPVRPITFALADGTPMHPLDALEMYAGRVAEQPEDIVVRLRYANTLRTLGYLDEAADQYQAVLDRDANQLEAWLNLAAIHVERKRKKAARNALQELVAHAPQSDHPERYVWEVNAQDFLDGAVPLETLTPESLFMPASEEEPTPKLTLGGQSPGKKLSPNPPNRAAVNAEREVAAHDEFTLI